MAGISLVAVGAVEDELMDAAERTLREVFGRDVRRWPERPAPPAAHDAARDQWNSALILRDLIDAGPTDGLKILAVTGLDLFIPMLSFVFGQAQLDGRVALVSTARLRQEFHGLPANPSLTARRLAREVVHEMGHVFGLTHCADPDCPMSLSTTIRMVDRKGDRLCGDCRLRLRDKAVFAGPAGEGGSST